VFLDSANCSRPHPEQVPTTDDSLKAGERGPTLLEDFHFLEKLQHFDRERVPERVVHARGTGAFGYFETYQPLTDLTRANIFSQAGKKTPVFVRFSTVQGSRGSADSVRDVRGFAVKFYTEEGNWDLVGNNIPVFFIQDSIKFPDLVHALKPEPRFEMPQAATAHDNFWDFISQTPESLHMVMWILSDRTIPRNFRAMQGFGVHTFIFQNAQGKETFVKFHWTPVNGAFSNLFDEAQKLAGKDPDFFRRDLYEHIRKGVLPEWELGIQTVPMEDEHKFDFDLLDSTKIIPEDLVPVRKIGKMVLNKVPDEFFTEVEQSAFAVARVVPGITFSNDPLLQGRVFSYHDTQLHRVGPNFHQLPTNRPLAPVANNQRDGPSQHVVHPSNVNYSPNGLAGNRPKVVAPGEGGYVHSVAVENGGAAGRKVQARPREKFGDHVSQAQLFYNSLSSAEKQHLVAAAWFEIGKCEDVGVRERMVDRLNSIDHGLAKEVAKGIGVAPPKSASGSNKGKTAPGLSLMDYLPSSAKGRKIAVLAENGVNVGEVQALKEFLQNENVTVDVVSTYLTPLTGSTSAAKLPVDKTFLTSHDTMYDGLIIPGGSASVSSLKKDGLAVHFVNETFKHCKPIAAIADGVELLGASDLPVVGFGNATSSANGEKRGEGETMTEKAANYAQSTMTSLLRNVMPSAVTDPMGIATVSGSDDDSVRDVGKRMVEMLKKHRFYSRESDPRVPA